MRDLFRTTLFAIALGLATPVVAQDTHHPQGSDQSQAQPAPPQAPAQRPGMGMMGNGMMGHGMSRMMPMMGMMQMMRSGAHIDGRLAFVKAELRITPTQEKVWEEFADSVRQAATKIRETGASMPMMSGMAGNPSPPQLLEQHEKHLMARLEAIRIVKPALAAFYAGLSDEQKKTLSELHPLFHGLI